MPRVPRKTPEPPGDPGARRSDAGAVPFDRNDEIFRLLVENTKDYAIFMLDPQGRVATWNEGARRIKGYRSDEVVGRHFSIFYAPEAVQSGWPEQELEYATREGRFEDEGWRVRRDGTRFWANVVITAVHDETGTLRGFGKVTRDITERKQHETEVQQLTVELAKRAADLDAANRELLQKSAENERFVYAVSHDLRSPLVNLQGFSRELHVGLDELRRCLDEAALPRHLSDRTTAVLDGHITESVGYIRHAVAHLSSIVEGLLRLSRVGRVEYRWDRVDMQAMVTQIVAAMHAEVTEKGAHVQVGTLPPAWGDRDAMAQIFANLIGNAVQNLDPQRAGQIEVGVRQDGSTVAYFVRDNGVGIPDEQQRRLFQSYQMQPGRARGEGMGLAIVKRIIDRHAGRVWVESTPGRGSTFFFALASEPPDGVGPGVIFRPFRE
jgi:PAS domain S-box-containing protein